MKIETLMALIVVAPLIAIGLYFLAALGLL